MSRKAHRGPLSGTGRGRRRVTQVKIDKMTEWRRQGLTHQEIGEREGCSERTSRRYVGHVEPRLKLPPGNPEPEDDPRSLRARLASEFVEFLHADERLRSFTFRWQKVDEATKMAIYGGPPSILFLSEAERLLRERLDAIGDLALRLLAREKQSQRRFLREVVGSLCADYVGWHQFADNFGETGEDWRPPRERPPAKEIDDDDIEPF
jgi:hypothetical protein